MDPINDALQSWQDRWPPGQRYLIGVSGGVDSVVLVHQLLAAGYAKLVVCHLDHGLRGKTSTADARWVTRLASRLNLPCVTARHDVRADAGISLETAGRQARHQFFAAAARQHRCPRIFLAHHADDQAETVLMNLCRGSAGPTGMTAETTLRVAGFRTPLTLLRPFLTVGKESIRLAASQNHYTFREDASNAVPDVVRNRLRLEVLPLLDAIFQRPAAPAIARAAAWTHAARAFLLDASAPWICQEKLPVTSLAALAPVLRDTILAGWLRARQIPDISTALIAQAAAMLDPATGPAKWNLPGNRFLRRRAGRLWVEPSNRPRP
jgi:tRNA(Ile)-lysidine synthase